MKQASGIYRHTVFDVYNQACFAGKEVANDRSPFRHIKFRDDHSGTDCFYIKALQLIEIDITHELFGLTILDLLQLDYATFRQLEKRINDIKDQRKIIMNNEIEKNKDLSTQKEKDLHGK